MKIRTGFVSNSSSSSFTLSNKKLKTGDVAREVMKLLNNGWIVDGGHPRLEDVNVFLDENSNFDDNIMIPWTCNYETWIFKNSDDTICLDTCNNENWGELPFECKEYFDELWGNSYIEHNFVPTGNREFLDLNDYQFKRRSKYNNQKYKKYSWNTESVGYNWGGQEDEV